jgi:hypothetical protein
MKNRHLVKIALLAAALLGVALSCSLDYLLDFELGDPVTVGNYVDVTYTLANHGSRMMDNAMITVRVSCDVAGGYGPQEQEQDTPWVDLLVGESASGTLTFTFADAVSNAHAEVVAAGWDEHVSSD